jgi:hypothetical protein
MATLHKHSTPVQFSSTFNNHSRQLIRYLQNQIIESNPALAWVARAWRGLHRGASVHA